MGRATQTWSVFALMLGACHSGETARRDAPIGGGDPSPSEVPQPRLEAADPWRIQPGHSELFGSTIDAAGLRRRYGAGAVETARIQLGEGETAPGTVLFPGDSLRRLEILWRDTVNQKSPARLILRGSRSQWQVGPGISLGTSLKDLQRLNRRTFTLAGFGWDYAGVVTDWQGGALASSLAGIKLYLDPGPSQSGSPAYSQVLGDRDYSSGLPAMQQLNPKVSQIFVDFD